MFLEALKQFLYGWLFTWVKNQLAEAEEKYAKKVLAKKNKTTAGKQ